MQLHDLKRGITEVINEVDSETRDEIADIIRKSLASHPGDSSCQCPAIEALAVLYRKGYVINHA